MTKKKMYEYKVTVEIEHYQAITIELESSKWHCVHTLVLTKHEQMKFKGLIYCPFLPLSHKCVLQWNKVGRPEIFPAYIFLDTGIWQGLGYFDFLLKIFIFVKRYCRI